MRGTMSQMENVSTEPTFELIPEGEYTVEVTNPKEGKTRNGDPMISITLDIIGGEHDGKKVWDNIILSENPKSKGWGIRWRAKMFLKSIGQPHHGDSFDWDSDKWIWSKCKINVIHVKQTEGKYAGKMKAVVDSYMPIEEGQKDSEIPF